MVNTFELKGQAITISYNCATPISCPSLNLSGMFSSDYLFL